MSGAPRIAQHAGAFSAGNPEQFAETQPDVPKTPEPPHGRYWPRENQPVDEASSPAPPPTGLVTPEPVAVAFTPEEPGDGLGDGPGDSISQLDGDDMPPPSNPYWKFPDSITIFH